MFAHFVKAKEVNRPELIVVPLRVFDTGWIYPPASCDR